MFDLPLGQASGLSSMTSAGTAGISHRPRLAALAKAMIVKNWTSSHPCARARATLPFDRQRLGSQEPIDSIHRDRRHAREADSDGPGRGLCGDDFPRGSEDILAAGELELEPDEASRCSGSANGMNPHSRATDVRCSAEVREAVEESVHEHVDLPARICTAVIGEVPWVRDTRWCRHTPTCRIRACACQISRPPLRPGGFARKRQPFPLLA